MTFNVESRKGGFCIIDGTGAAVARVDVPPMARGEGAVAYSERMARAARVAGVMAHAPDMVALLKETQAELRRRLLVEGVELNNLPWIDAIEERARRLLEAMGEEIFTEEDGRAYERELFAAKKDGEKLADQRRAMGVTVRALALAMDVQEQRIGQLTRAERITPRTWERVERGLFIAVLGGCAGNVDAARVAYNSARALHGLEELTGERAREWAKDHEACAAVLAGADNVATDWKAGPNGPEPIPAGEIDPAAALRARMAEGKL